MTSNHARKKQARSLAAVLGINYTAALRQLDTAEHNYAPSLISNINPVGVPQSRVISVLGLTNSGKTTVVRSWIKKFLSSGTDGSDVTVIAESYPASATELTQNYHWGEYSDLGVNVLSPGDWDRALPLGRVLVIEEGYHRSPELLAMTNSMVAQLGDTTIIVVDHGYPNADLPSTVATVVVEPWNYWLEMAIKVGLTDISTGGQRGGFVRLGDGEFVQYP